MDRSNFNPDQLHEHFDRLKNDLGVELEDNARIVKLPSGHRFGIGESHVKDHPKNYETLVRMDLLSEYGRVGQLKTFLGGGYASNVSVDFNEDRKGLVEGNSHHSVSWTIDKDKSGSWSPNDPGQRWWHTNPDSDTMDSIMKVVEARGGNISSETIQNPGVFRVRQENPHRADHDWMAQDPARDLGSISMNRKSGRFEWIPD